MSKTVQNLSNYWLVSDLSRETTIKRGVISKIAKQNKIESILVGSIRLIQIDSFVDYLRWHYYPRKEMNRRSRKVREFVKKYQNEKD